MEAAVEYAIETRCPSVGLCADVANFSTHAPLKEDEIGPMARLGPARVIMPQAALVSTAFRLDDIKS